MWFYSINKYINNKYSFYYIYNLLIFNCKNSLLLKIFYNSFLIEYIIISFEIIIGLSVFFAIWRINIFYIKPYIFKIYYTIINKYINNYYFKRNNNIYFQLNIIK